MKLKVKIIFVFLFVLACPAQARLLQIIHTNDLHSYFERGDDSSRGSYAAVAGVIDELKAQAQSQGIETLTLDGGDFSEGSPFFIANQGVDSWQMMQSMGYDAIEIGNHDWFVGAAAMETIVNRVHPKVPFLGANLHFNSIYKGLNRFIKPHAEFTRSGIKIAVVGLATHELIYRWLAKDGKISSPVAAMKKELSELRHRNDLVIALTHLGVSADQALVRQTQGIDLVVGGHSHTALQAPIFEKSGGRSDVPIVQTGAHGQFVGDLLVDFEPGRPLRVVRYQLVPVWRGKNPNAEIAREVALARKHVEYIYTQEWLYQKIGVADSPIEVPVSHPTVWGDFFTAAMRDAVHADVGLDESQFYGFGQGAGPITRETVLNFYPHYFDLKRPQGWTVWTLKVKGWELALVLKTAVKAKSFFNLSNCAYNVQVDSSGNPSMTNLRVGGQKIRALKTYTVAVSEGLGLGAKKLVGGALSVLLKPRDSGIPVWEAVEHKLLHESQETFDPESYPVQSLPGTIEWRPARIESLL